MFLRIRSIILIKKVSHDDLWVYKKLMEKIHQFFYSTVTDLARLRGLSTSQPFRHAV